MQTNQPQLSPRSRLLYIFLVIAMGAAGVLNAIALVSSSPQPLTATSEVLVVTFASVTVTLGLVMLLRRK